MALTRSRAAAAELRVHVRDVIDYELEPRIGVLRRPLGWPGGASAYRVVYSAGYAAMPDDVQEACAQIERQLTRHLPTVRAVKLEGVEANVVQDILG